LSYPLLHSRVANLAISVSYQHKALDDAYDAVDVSEKKHSHGVPISLQFDVRDDLFGGGLFFGAVTWTAGELHLDHELRRWDRATTRSHGRFDKVNMELVRLQHLPAGFGLYGRISAQWTGDNLDSSESFGLGGVGGIRAYPAGEAFGDEGLLGQIELRYTTAGYSPYLFYDHGKIRINAEPGPQVEAHSEERSGAGLGLRWQYAGLRLNTSLAWRLTGGEPDSDHRDRRPRWWATLERAF